MHDSYKFIYPHISRSISVNKSLFSTIFWATTSPMDSTSPEASLPPQPVNHNFLARYKYGNKEHKKGRIGIIHWNKGLSLLTNKMDDLATIIDNHKPLVLGISEANFRKNYHIEEVQLTNYNIHISPTIDNPEHGVSRIVVYTHIS